jgi:hypothetical protein
VRELGVHRHAEDLHAIPKHLRIARKSVRLSLAVPIF